MKSSCWSKYYKWKPSGNCSINTAIQYSYMNIYTLIGSVHSSFQWPAETRPQEANAEFAAWKLWVGVNCTWLYIGSQDAWAVFIIYLFFRSSFPFTPTDVTSIACLFKIILIKCCLVQQVWQCPSGAWGQHPWVQRRILVFSLLDGSDLSNKLMYLS